MLCVNVCADIKIMIIYFYYVEIFNLKVFEYFKLKIN